MGKTSLAARALCYKEDGIIVETGQLMCSIYGVTMANTKFQVEQHIKSQKHVVNMGLKQKYQTIPGTKTQQEFGRDICEVFVRCNIPLYKLNNDAMKDFLMQYTSRVPPNESTIRKNYVKSLYIKTIENIRNAIGDSNIWASIDETTDATGRYIANVIVGKMDDTTASESYLLHTVQLDRTNSTTICQTLNEAFEILWPTRIQYNRVRVLVTDAAPYIVKAARDLSAALYTKMIHVTCLAHTFHRVADFIRGEYKKADELISCMKKVFLKAPYRMQMLKEKYPQIRTPPKPVLTRWGTWLLAAMYYAEEWDHIKSAVDEFEDDAVAVAQAKELLSDDETFRQITYVNQHYVFLEETITNLERKAQSVADTLKIFEEAYKEINSAPNQKVKKKLKSAVDKNSGLTLISKIISGSYTELKATTLFSDATPALFSKFTYIPLVSCDVERSFSRY